MGFLGFGNYSKPGKGVKKGGPEKKRFFVFFELYFRKISKLIQLNLLFLVFCIPAFVVFFGGRYLTAMLYNQQMVSILSAVILVVAITLTGPATAGMMRIARHFVEEKPVFMLSDFTQAVKSNAKQGLMMGFLNAILITVVFQSFTFYYAKAVVSSMWYWVPVSIIMFIGLVSIMANFYTFLAMVSVDLGFKGLIKNCVSFAFLGAKTNFITLFFVLLVTISCLWYFPLTIPVFALITFSTLAMITAFNSFQYIYKYSIRPYYLMNGLEDPYEVQEDEQESIFEDTTV